MSAQLKGFKELEKALKSLPDRLQRRVMRAAMSAAATPVLRAVRPKVGRRSGLTKKAIGKKVSTNTKRQSVSATIGARTNVVGTYKGKAVKPSRYFHLQDKGFINAAGEHVPGNRGLEQAFTESESQVLNVMETKLAAGIEKEAKAAV